MGPHDYEIAAMNRERHEDALRTAMNDRIADQTDRNREGTSVGKPGRLIRRGANAVATVLLTAGSALERWAVGV